MGWLMCTKAGAEVQQFCAEKHSLMHTRLVWRSSVPGAQRCCFRMSPQKIRKYLSFPATCRSLPVTEQSFQQGFLNLSAVLGRARHTKGLPAVQIERD